MPDSPTRFDVVVLGAGAAGLMCAIEAGKRGRKVAVLERAEKVGKKVLISGGGRCNFTNLHCKPENFLSDNPHFCKSALARYTPATFIALVQKYGIAYHEKTLGQLFCDGSSRQIVDMLENECATAGVRIFTDIAVSSIRKDVRYVIETSDGDLLCDSLVIATGGMSIPKMGATAFGYEVAKQFAMKIISPRPALVPLTFNPADLADYAELAGISTEVIAAIGKRRFRENLLFTHRGLSGPAILQMSSYWGPLQPISIDLAPDRDLTSDLRSRTTGRDITTAKALFRTAFPARLADKWLALNAPARWNSQAIAQLEYKVHHWQVVPQGTEGFDKAEVTAGGVDTDELSSPTLQSKKQPGLFFIGEVVDVTGHLGGFNFQWAWASGFCAGQAV